MKKDKKPDQDKRKSQEDPADLDTCTMAPEFAEHARPNEPAREPCDDGRAGGDIITEKKQEKKQEKEQEKEQCKDIVKEREDERQHTMDKMSLDTSEVHTYDKNQDDDSEKCS